MQIWSAFPLLQSDPVTDPIEEVSVKVPLEFLYMLGIGMLPKVSTQVIFNKLVVGGPDVNVQLMRPIPIGIKGVVLPGRGDMLAVIIGKVWNYNSGSPQILKKNVEVWLLQQYVYGQEFYRQLINEALGAFILEIL